MVLILSTLIDTWGAKNTVQALKFVMSLQVSRTRALDVVLKIYRSSRNEAHEYRFLRGGTNGILL